MALGFNITGTAAIPIEWKRPRVCSAYLGSTAKLHADQHGLMYFSDPDWTNYPSRFYRIRSPLTIPEGGLSALAEFKAIQASISFPKVRRSPRGKQPSEG